MADTEQLSYYEIDGKHYPRVTHILKVLGKPGLDRWRGRYGNQEADNISREGSRIGTEFHAVAQEINMGRHMQRGWQAPGELRIMADAYTDWMHKNIARVEQTERTYHYQGSPLLPPIDHPEDEDCEDWTCSCHRRFAGTLDLLAQLRGDSGLSIIDLKTSNNVSDDWPLQLSAYKMMVEAATGQDIQRRLIVQIPKKGVIKAVMYDYPDHAEDEWAWNNTLSMWKWMQKAKARAKSARAA